MADYKLNTDLIAQLIVSLLPHKPVLNALGFLVSGCISLCMIVYKFHVILKIPSLSKIWMSIKGSFNMFACLLLPNLYSNFSVILLGISGGNVATGIYSSGHKFVSLCDGFTKVLSRTFFPFLARRIDKHQLYVKISGIISIVMSLGLFLCADLLVKIFYTPEFKDAALVIRIMSIAPFFLFLMNTYGTNYLVLQKKEAILRNIILCCSMGGFILAWITILNFSYIGVAITITSVWGVRGFLTYYYANK
ncbi:hypothetical protein EZS27_027917 [termite gut metagenome]|uniref:O-antigen transporter n=1 Tax=termite gut metagenome TaxID=433724 RepID=A0A5J4QN15_9ZZZZ